MKPQVYSFEDGLPNDFNELGDSELNISERHKKDGKCSLQWSFSAGDAFTINSQIGYRSPDPDRPSRAASTFALFIYSERRLSGLLRFSFGSNDESNCHFRVSMDFEGWRALWVQFDRDMIGKPTESMNQLKVQAENFSGTLFFDQIILSTLVDPRHPVRDRQAPHVNLQADHQANRHWVSLYLYECYQNEALADRSKLTPSANTETSIQQITERLHSFWITENKPAILTQQEAEKEFLHYEIKHQESGATHGRTIDAKCHKAVYPQALTEELSWLTNSIDMKQCSEFMLQLAFAYIESEANQAWAGPMFYDLSVHLQDQGWTAGSGLGTTHHLGYVMRDYYRAFFLMRDYLTDVNLLSNTQATMAWFSGLGRIFERDKEHCGENVDVLNTLAQGMLASILLLDDTREKVIALRAYSNWLSRALLPAPGLMGTIKEDGSIYHHCNHYPAYGLGGFKGVAPILYMLSRTEFAVPPEGHQSLKKAMLMMRIYTNLRSWPISFSARHPVGRGKHSGINSLMPFLYLALAGSPDQQESIDSEVAGAYLRLVGTEDDEDSNALREQGFRPESAPEGHWTMNQAAAALHRRGEWLVSIRAHSRYLWANESYLRANRYGRYISHGHLQIMAQGNPINNADSGYLKEGWDHNCWPGTTVIYLPIEELKSDVRNVDIYSGFEEMLLSDESFAGGVNMDGDGIFGMKLHEHAKYNGSHRARKSWFFFGSHIVCLGTNIENNNSDYPTVTTLYQTHLKSSNSGTFCDGKEYKGLTTDLEFCLEKPMWLLDNTNNGYLVGSGHTVRHTRSLQSSRAHDNDEVIENNYAKAWLDHGKSPQESSYRYLVAVNTTPKEMEDLSRSFSSSPPYEVLNASYDSHIIRNNMSRTLNYVLFEACNDLTDGFLASVDTPALVMEREVDDSLFLHIADPDLRLYADDPEQYDEDGKQREVSLYSRPWRSSDSKEHPLSLRIHGRWELLDEQYNSVHKDGFTCLTVPCKAGQPIELHLTRA